MRTGIKIAAISLIFIAAITVVACRRAATPTAVVRQLHAAIIKEDAKAIGELMTVEGAQAMVLFLEKASGIMAAQGDITNTEEIIDGDTAIVIVSYSNGEASEWDLVRIDGSWKVDLDMSK